MQFPRFLSRIPLRIHFDGEGAGGGGGQSAASRGGLESSKASQGRASRGGAESAKRSRQARASRGGLESAASGRALSTGDLAAITDAIGGGAVKPVVPSPPPPPPAAEPKEAQDVFNRSLVAERKRRGRRATILTSPRGLEDQLGIITRPQARGAELLGG